MGKVRYKQPSEAFENSVSKVNDSNLRASLGREKSVGEYHFLSLSNIVPYKKQARKIFSSDEIAQLAQTIREHGITSPLQVISSEDYPGKFEVISGERRLKAAQLIGLDKIPCIILKNYDRIEEIALIENIQRKDLHPVELGNSLASIVKNYQWGDISALAEKIGKPQSTISLHISYSKFPSEIKDYLLKNDIRSRDILRKLVSCENMEQMSAVLGMKEKNVPSPIKSILRISFQNSLLKVQDHSLEKLDKEILSDLKDTLKKIIAKIEKITSE